MKDEVFEKGSAVLLAALINGGDRATELFVSLVDGTHSGDDTRYTAETAAELFLLSGLGSPESYRDTLLRHLEFGTSGSPEMDRYALDWLRNKHPEIF